MIKQINGRAAAILTGLLLSMFRNNYTDKLLTVNVLFSKVTMFHWQVMAAARLRCEIYGKILLKKTKFEVPAKSYALIGLDMLPLVNARQFLYIDRQLVLSFVLVI